MDRQIAMYIQCSIDRYTEGWLERWSDSTEAVARTKPCQTLACALMRSSSIFIFSAWTRSISARVAWRRKEER